MFGFFRKLKNKFVFERAWRQAFNNFATENLSNEELIEKSVARNLNDLEIGRDELYKLVEITDKKIISIEKNLKPADIVISILFFMLVLSYLGVNIEFSYLGINLKDIQKIGDYILVLYLGVIAFAPFIFDTTRLKMIRRVLIRRLFSENQSIELLQLYEREMFVFPFDGYSKAKDIRLDRLLLYNLPIIFALFSITIFILILAVGVGMILFAVYKTIENTAWNFYVIIPLYFLLLVAFLFNTMLKLFESIKFRVIFSEKSEEFLRMDENKRLDLIKKEMK